MKGLPIFSFISFRLFFFLLSFYLFLLLFLFFPTSCLLVSEVTPSARDHRPCTAQTAKPPQTTTLRPHPSAVSAVAQHPAAGRAAWRPELCQGSGWKGVSANAPGRRAGYGRSISQSVGRSVRQPLPSGEWRLGMLFGLRRHVRCLTVDGSVMLLWHNTGLGAVRRWGQLEAGVGRWLVTVRLV